MDCLDADWLEPNRMRARWYDVQYSSIPRTAECRVGHHSPVVLTRTCDAHIMEHSTSPPDARNDSPVSRNSDDSLAIRKRRIKAHRKSRGGCLTCKTRKVKVSSVQDQALNLNAYIM